MKKLKRIEKLLLVILGGILQFFGYKSGDVSIPKEPSERIAIGFTCICSLVYTFFSACLMLGTEGSAAFFVWIVNFTCVLQTLSSLIQRHKEYMSRKRREYEENYAEAYVKEHIPDPCAGGVFKSISTALNADKELELTDIKVPETASPYKARVKLYAIFLLGSFVLCVIAYIALCASDLVLENGLNDWIVSALLIALVIVFLGIGFFEVLIEQSVAWFRAEA